MRIRLIKKITIKISQSNKTVLVAVSEVRMAEKENQKGLIVFQDKKIRRLWHNNEWFFSVVDVVEVLTDSQTPRQYWSKVKDR